jgi:hypothetical protein
MEFHKTPVGVTVFHIDGQMDGRDLRLVVAIRFANMPKVGIRERVQN